MLVPEFYFRRWGGRSAGSGGKFEVPPPPPGRSVMEWGGAGDTDAGARAKEGLGGSERPRLKARHPPPLWALWHPIARPMIWGVGDSRGAVR